MAKQNKKRKFEGRWTPNEIQNIPRSVLDLLGKEVFAHIFSFGEKGCYQSNETMAKIFMVSARTISRRIAAIKKADLVYVKSPKGYYRTLWAKTHPDVKEAIKLWYRDSEISKTELKAGRKTSTPLRQNCLSELDKTGEVTATNGVFRLRQNCPTTNKETNKETNKKTIATPPPLPAGGQAPALLEDRKAGNITRIEQLKESFGLSARRRGTKPTNAEWEASRQANQRALKAAGMTDTNKQ